MNDTDVTRALDLARSHGLLDDVAWHTADRLGALLDGDPLDRVLLALAARGPSHGHVAHDLTSTDDLLAAVELAEVPDAVRHELATVFAAAVTHVRADPSATTALRRPAGDGSPLTPLVVDGDLVYLDRWFRLEQDVAAALHRRLGPVDGPARPDGPPPAAVQAALDDVLGVHDHLQREAVRATATRTATVLAGGPGTGKTWTAARVLAVAALLHDEAPLVALAAPTGKAAARLSEGVEEALGDADLPVAAVDGVRTMLGDGGTTLHRLLGLRSGRRPWFDRHNRLPHDLVLVDEASMVALPLMGQLLDALRDDATLVLLGDPHQLASVEAGTVLGDVVHAMTAVAHPAVVTLTRVHRFAEGSGIARLAGAVRDGDAGGAAAALVDADDLTWLQDADDGLASVRALGLARGRTLHAAASRGDASAALSALGGSIVLAAHRRGPSGVTRLRDLVDDALGEELPTWASADPHQVGRPVLVTANDRLLGVHNGDLGVVVRGPDGVRVVFDIPAADGGRLHVHPDRLPPHESVHAMTIHKSQGSQWDHVVVVLPRVGSPLLTRELLYTAITRARSHVTVVGDETVLADAVGRRVRRASGLGHRLAALLDNA